MRSALIVTATLIVTPLVTFIIMDHVGLTANLMSLGGLVIAIGMMVDGRSWWWRMSIVIWQNKRGDRFNKTQVITACRHRGRTTGDFRHLDHHPRVPSDSDAPGHGRKNVSAVANTIMIALVVSLVLSLTLSPSCALWR